MQVGSALFAAKRPELLPLESDTLKVTVLDPLTVMFGLLSVNAGVAVRGLMVCVLALAVLLLAKEAVLLET